MVETRCARRCFDATRDHHRPGSRHAVAVRAAIGSRSGPFVPDESLVPLSVLLLPAQLLAGDESALAGGAVDAVHAAARLPGLARFPRAELALRDVAPAALLQGQPLLARSVLEVGPL